MTTRFIVVRHGETEWNVAARVQGQLDSDLTINGRAQADAIAARMAGESFDTIISSDLGRAMETARRIAFIRRIPVVPDARLRERHFGVGQGHTYDELDRKWPNVFTRTGPADPDVTIPEGETRREFHERVRSAFHALGAEHEGKRIAVVCHGGVLAALYRIVRDIPVAEAFRIPIANASYNAVSLANNHWTIEAWDDTAHLPEAVPFVES
jgi:probable phosphoglycerate mutase